MWIKIDKLHFPVTFKKIATFLALVYDILHLLLLAGLETLTARWIDIDSV